MDKEKKLAFYEIGEGSLYKKVQSLFEQGQIEAMERNDDVTVVLKIHIAPPEETDNKFGKASFEADLKLPAYKSMIYTTELRGGMIINTGDSLVDLLQTSLELPLPENTFPMRKQDEV